MGNKIADIIVTTKLREISPIESVTITMPYVTAVKLRNILGKTVNEPGDVYELFSGLDNAGISPNLKWQRTAGTIDCKDL